MISLVILSLSTTFASDDVSDVLSDDEVTINETLSADGDYVSIDVTNETINNYINESGYINVTADELVFDGSDFSNLNLNIDKSITLKGNNSKLINPTITILSSNVLFNNFTIIQTSGDYSISILGSEDTAISNVTISNSNINFTDDESGETSIAINAIYVSEFKLLDNTIEYIGKTNGTVINNVIFISNSNNVEFKRNKINAKLVSAYVPWPEIPEGSYNYVRSPVSEGIVIVDSDDVVLDSNVVDVNYTAVSSSYDTIYSVDFVDCDNAVISNNNITSNGFTYIYGIIFNGNNFTIDSNKIVSTGDYYANGIDLEGSNGGVVKNNNIVVNAVSSAYAVYSGMGGQSVYASYESNNISGFAYNIFAFSLGDVESNVTSNIIKLEGNYTTGIAFRGSKVDIVDNDVELVSSEEGNQSIWEAFGVEAVGIKVFAGVATIKENNVSTAGRGICLNSNLTSALLEKNVMSVSANEDKDASAIYANEVSSLKIVNNEIQYTGATNGTGINYAVYINSVNGANVSFNKFNLSLVSAHVPWPEIPEGSYNYVRSPISEGIVIIDSNDVIFDDNVLDVNYTAVSGSYDTIYSVDFVDCDNAVISNNNITSNGFTYIYGIIFNGNNFTIDSNKIVSTGDYYANGIDVEGLATGVIKNNVIVANANTSSYPIYGAMSNGNIYVDIINNEINGTAYLVYGIQLAGCEISIEDNNITTQGNYTIGIGSVIDEVYINNNTILSNASNEGNLTVWEVLGSTTQGILIASGDAKITNNNINTTGEFALNLGESTVLLKDNTLNSNSSNNTNSSGYVVDLENETTLEIILSASDLTKVYGDSIQFVVTALNQNNDSVVGRTISLSVNGDTLESITDENGNAKFNLSLNAGKYDIMTSFAGDIIYSSKNITNTITVTKKPTVITAPSTTVLLTVIKSGYTYKITLKDNLGKVLSKKLTIAFNGKLDSVTTGTNGIAIYKLSVTKVGTYKLTVKFDGDDNYVASSSVATIKLTKQTTKLSAGKKTFKVKVKTKKYTVTLKDNKNKPIKGVKLTLKVKGKTYSAKTNAKGQAIFKITKLTKRGTYKAVIKFAGNNYYNVVSKTVKITVKK